MDKNIKVALITPYDRFYNVARDTDWFLPVDSLLRYRFDNIEAINSNPKGMEI
jgi:hypothetical protein